MAMVRMPPGGDKREQLLQSVIDGNFGKAKAAIEAGANVNGSPGQVVPLIVVAAMINHADMVKFLLEQGADPDKPIPLNLTAPPKLGITTTASSGERALHVAARTGAVEIVRVLLKRFHADPNATDDEGYTPLSMASQREHICRACVEIVSLLLEAGADPSLGDKNGLIPLHAVAQYGHMELVDLLYSAAPATLNCSTLRGETPLLLACHVGHESMVSKLLALDATQLPFNALFPLVAATRSGFLGVVRLLITDGGVLASGGPKAWAEALSISVCCRHARILRLLLESDGGKEMRSVWIDWRVESSSLLSIGAAYCYPAAVSFLLKAGAKEAVRDEEGCTPRDIIGRDLGRNGQPPRGQGEEVAIRRMLQRGPAYRARSWAWPSDAKEEADAGGSGDYDTADAGTAADGVMSCRPAAVKTPPPDVSVRIFRPKENSRNIFFMSAVGRYCEKS